MIAEFAVIDSHIHVQPWDMMKPEALRMMQGRRPDHAEIREMMYDSGKFLAFLDRERIEKAVAINYVSPDIMGFTEEVNDYIASFAGKCGGRLLGFGSVHPTRSENPEREMDRIIASGIRGVKFHPSHQACHPNAYRDGNRIVETIYRKAQEAGLVLMIHTGTSVFPGARNIHADPIFCDDVAVDFPRLRIILAHGGRPLWMETAMFVVRRHPNVWMDISSIPPRNLPEYFPRLEALADKVLWGSDWPGPGVPGMRSNVDAFLALPYPDDMKRKILSENARRLYGL